MEFKEREHWGSQMGFVLAAAGSAVGLGNVWKFPFITGMYGGAAFVMFYLVSILIIGLPVMLIEFSIGRKTQTNAVGAFRTLAPNSPAFLIGVLGVLAAFVILSYYSVVGGWTLAYIWEALNGMFSQYTDSAVAGAAFGQFVAHPLWPLLTHFTFMGLCIAIVLMGVKKGIERSVFILMPVLIVIILLLVVRGVTLEGSGAGLSFLFAPDFSKLTGSGMLTALGHAFFTLSLGMGAMLTYGSYLSPGTNLIKSAVWIIIMDTAIALLAGTAIFTAVFAMGFEPNSGPGLVFHVLPVVFSKMPGGFAVGILFFFLLAIAALTSGISLLEVVTAYFVDQRGWSRKKATVVFGSAIFLLGVPSAWSFGILEKVTLLGMGFFDIFDYLSFKYMLPLGGLAMVIFTLFRWKPESFIQELQQGAPGLRVSPSLVRLLLVLSGLFITVTFVAELVG